LILALLLVVIGAPSAFAAAPGNDNFVDATVITALPYSDVVDTTEATVEGTDPLPVACGFELQSTVWYSFTPGTDGDLAVDTLGSGYDTTLAVFTGSPGNLVEVGCNDDAVGLQSRVIWTADAAVTYFIMAGSYSPGGGSLHLNLHTSAGPFAVEDFAVNTTGRVQAKTGVATISGTLVCSGEPGRVYLEVSLRQRIGRAYVHGFNDGAVLCEGSRTWSVTVSGSDGLFVAGRASAAVFASWDADSRSIDTIVRLRGK
jgi:hypothetical protein